METAGRERREIELLLEDSPSLRGEVAAIASAGCGRARVAL